LAILGPNFALNAQKKKKKKKREINDLLRQQHDITPNYHGYKQNRHKKKKKKKKGNTNRHKSFSPVLTLIQPEISLHTS